MMKEFVDILTFAAVLGSGLLEGIFFAFSTFVMRALGQPRRNTCELLAGPSRSGYTFL